VEHFKIAEFEREHGQGTFPRFRSLSPPETTALATSLLQVLALPVDAGPLELLSVIRSRSLPIDAVNADDENFCLGDLLRKLNYPESELVYLNWYQYDEIDECRTEDVVRLFHDIWYPSADDLELIDSQLKWILSIEHHGMVRGLRLP